MPNCQEVRPPPRVVAYAQRLRNLSVKRGRCAFFIVEKVEAAP